MSGGSEDGEGMKPVDSGEGDKRDIDDADAPELDGFTILDAEPSTTTKDNPPADDDRSADGGDGGKTNPADDATNGASATADDTKEDPAEGDTTEDTDSVDGKVTDDAGAAVEDATDGDMAGGEKTAANDQADGSDGDESGELSFDEWLAAAEIPTDDPNNPASGGDGAVGDSTAAAGSRGRKKNRRSRRSRKKSAAAEKASSNNNAQVTPDDGVDADADAGSAETTSADTGSAASGSAETSAADGTSADSEVTGTSMSEIMAELLAAAEQSSLEHADDDNEALDTEVALDPEATSEFAAADSGTKPATSAAIAAVRAGSTEDAESDDSEGTNAKTAAADKTSSKSEVPAVRTDEDEQETKDQPTSEASAPDKAASTDKPDADGTDTADTADAKDTDATSPGSEDTDDAGATDTSQTSEDIVSKGADAKDSEAEDDGTDSDAKSEASKAAPSEDTDAGTKDAVKEDAPTKDAGKKDAEDKDTDGKKDADSKKDVGDTDADSKTKDSAANKGADSKTKDSQADKDGTAADSSDKTAAASVQSPVESKSTTPTVAPLRRPEKSSAVPTAAIAVVAAVVGLYAILVVGWALDSVAHDGEAMRGVRVADVPVGGSNEEALGEVLDTLDTDLEASELTVSVDDVDVVTDPFSLGIRHDREPMIEQALEARRGGFIAFRPIRWLFHLFSSEDIPAQYTIDSALAAEGAKDIISPELSPPVEPTMELRGSQMALVPGETGVAVEPDEIVALLPDIVDGQTPYQLALTAETANPELTDDAVAAVVDEINEQTEQPILAQVLDQEAEISPRMLKTWMTLENEDAEPDWSIDEELALEDLKPLFPALGSEDQQARFSVVDGEPIIIPASETVICCEASTLAGLGAAIKRSIPDPIEPPEGSPEDAEPIQQLRRARLEPAITGQDEGVAELKSLGIIEEISTFTTPHACCQNRVINIQRFADLMQGVVIRPGEEFSLNEFVGQRTRENGFVADGAIVLGNFEPQVGGGISQYATTFFNASFFAGIEFLEYQSHSIYISRYPRGREATISWRRPDLKVLNNTDYGILVWNEYTDTSITVTFYSTKNREVEALPLLRSSDRQCRIDITPRVITFEDGTVEEDSVRAIYRPGQGLDCNGNSTTPEEDKPEPANNVAPDPEPEPDEDDGDGEVLPPGG